MKKKVCFVISSLEAGGAERVFSILIDNFNAEIYDIYVIILNNNNQFFRINNENINIIDLKVKRAYKSVFKLLKKIKEIQPNAIYCTGTHLNVIMGLLKLYLSNVRNKEIRFIARQSNIPNLINKHSSIKSKLVNWLISYSYNCFDYIVCQSVEMRDSLKNFYQVNERKLTVISNPVNSYSGKMSKRYSPTKSIVNIGRLNPVKGQLRLIEIFSELKIDCFLSIYGHGNMENDLQRDILDKGLQNSVKILAPVKNVPFEISKFDLLVISSYTEGFPNVALEALTVGVPVVSFDVGGIGEIIKSGFNGYIVAQGDNKGFENAILHSLKKDWIGEEIIKDVNARFSISRIIEQYHALIIN